MKKHIRAFVSLLCAAALALGCASCGGAAQSTGKSGGTAGVTHITVWNYYNRCRKSTFLFFTFVDILSLRYLPR